MWHASLNVMEQQGHLGIASDTITYNAIMKVCQSSWEHAFMALQEMWLAVKGWRAFGSLECLLGLTWSNLDEHSNKLQYAFVWLYFISSYCREMKNWSKDVGWFEGSTLFFCDQNSWYSEWFSQICPWTKVQCDLLRSQLHMRPGLTLGAIFKWN